MKPVNKEKLKEAGEKFHNNFLGKAKKIIQAYFSAAPITKEEK